MRRPFLLFVLGIGALFGFGSGIHELRWRHWAQRSAFERHVAQICVDAARTGQLPPGPGPGGVQGPGGGGGW
jgi:hypothetical protein